MLLTVKEETMADSQGTSPERQFVSWLEDYMSVWTAGCITDPDLAMLDKLLFQTDLETIFRILYSVRGGDNRTALHCAICRRDTDVIRSLLICLRPVHHIKILWAAPQMEKIALTKLMFPFWIAYLCTSTWTLTSSQKFFLKFFMCYICLAECYFTVMSTATRYDDPRYDDEQYEYHWKNLLYVPYNMMGRLLELIRLFAYFQDYGLMAIKVAVYLIFPCLAFPPALILNLILLPLIYKTINPVTQMVQTLLMHIITLARQLVALDLELIAIHDFTINSEEIERKLYLRLSSINEAPIYTAMQSGLSPSDSAVILQTILEIVHPKCHDALFKAYFSIPGRVGMHQRALSGYYEYHMMFVKQKRMKARLFGECFETVIVYGSL